MRGFYKGIDKQMLGCLVTFSIYFYSHKYFKNRFMKSQNDLFGNLKASLIAAVICSISTNPYWVVYTRYQTEKKQQKGNQKNVHKGRILQIIKDIYKNEGVQGFFKGIKPALILVSNPVIQFFCYEFFK